MVRITRMCCADELSAVETRKVIEMLSLHQQQTKTEEDPETGRLLTKGHKVF